MSISGNIAMSVLRAVHPGKGSLSNYEKSLKKAKRENERFSFRMPKSRRAELRLVENTPKPCLVIRPHNLKYENKVLLYLYGGVTNQWNTQRRMAIQFALDAGVETWYPVYPAITEVSVAESVAYITDIYRRMRERFSNDKIAVNGVSMGGYFALQIVNTINREGLDIPMPDLLLAHSAGGIPQSDEDWNELRRFEARDPMFSESDLRMVDRLIPHDTPISKELLAPALGRFTGAPDTYLYYGEEMLAGNATGYRRAFAASGVSSRLHVAIVPNMMHGYSCLPVFPESKQSYYEAIDRIQKM